MALTDVSAKAVGIFKGPGLPIALVTAAAALAGCGSGSDDGDASTSGIAAGTAERLASMSDGIASSLESGDTCGAAAQADDLRAAVSRADLPAELRREAEAAADQLVNEVNCEAPEEIATVEQDGGGEDEGGEEKEEGQGEGSGSEGDGGDAGGGDEGGDSGVPPGHGGTPPGQVGKIKGGI
jgi:hypothetical protein